MWNFTFEGSASFGVKYVTVLFDLVCNLDGKSLLAMNKFGYQRKSEEEPFNGLAKVSY